MKKLKFLTAMLFGVAFAGCSSAYYASAGYASDDLYAIHDKTEIARKKKAEAEAERAAAEARKAEWEARLAEARAAAARDDYYEYRSEGSESYSSVLADDYESAYARRLRGFESPSYKMPSSYMKARYSSTFNYVSAYDPAFYNIVVMGDQVWVEPKYITSMFGSWGTVVYSDPWYYGWNRPWGPSFSFGSWGWSFGWNSPWYDPWYGPSWRWGSWYDPWYGYHGWYGPHHHHHHHHWYPGCGRPYHSNIVRRPHAYTSPMGGRYGSGSRYGSSSKGSMRGNGGRGYFGVRSKDRNNTSGGRYNSGRSHGNSRYDYDTRRSGSNSYNRGNSSYNRGSSSHGNYGGGYSGGFGGGSRGGSGTTSSGGSYRNSGGR